MTGPNNTLNLDELFGIAKPVKILVKGATYELMRPEGFSPVQYQKFAKLFEQWTKNHLDATTDPTVLDGMMTEIIETLNHRLSELEMPFGWKVKILEFYTEEALQDKLEKGTTAVKNRTGA